MEHDESYAVETSACSEEFDQNGNPRRVENLHFIEGVLGQGAFGTVRLARRIMSDGCCDSPPSPPPLSRNGSGLKRILSTPRRLAKSHSVPKQGSDFFSGEFKTESPPILLKETKSPSVVGNLGLFIRSKVSFDIDEDEEQLVAVKIFSKSILKRRKTMIRDKSTRRMKVKTAMQQVEREIALMKKLSHPNLVALYEVIDSPHSDMLYMVLEYMPLGEILTYQDDGTFRRKEPKAGCTKAKVNGILDGHFTEEQAALYFVDILHGLGYLHQHHIVHRDLKPENILLDSKGIAKVGDFGVSHIFEKESDFGVHRHFSVGESSDDSSIEIEKHPPNILTRSDTNVALEMKGLGNEGMLTKTEGTWCFWSPEMCKGSQKFSGYAADMWAAGVCLYIFVTGKLPFYSEIPTELFEIISKADIDFQGLGLSNQLVDLLKRCLEKDPAKRAGVGDCLTHPFLQQAREKRIKQLSTELEISRKRKIVISEQDIKMAFKTVTGLPVVLIRSASKTLQAGSKKLQEGLAEAKGKLSFASSSDSMLPHGRLFQKQGSNASVHSESDCVDENSHRSLGSSFRARMQSIGLMVHSTSNSSLNRILRKQTSNTSDLSSSSSCVGFGSNVGDQTQFSTNKPSQQHKQQQQQHGNSDYSFSFDGHSSVQTNDGSRESTRNVEVTMQDISRLSSGITSACSFDTTNSMGELPMVLDEEDELNGTEEMEEVVGDVKKRRKIYEGACLIQ